MPQRILHLHINTPSVDCAPLLSFLKGAIPFYEAPGGVRVRLLRSMADPTRFIEIVEYDSVAAFERDQLRVEHDPAMAAQLATWRTLLAGGVEVEAYEEITDQL
jgi:hypothetical protein